MIKKMPKITAERYWNPRRIRSLCIEQNWYTSGSNRDYDEMQDFVRENEPTPENIYWVAADILEHSGKAREEGQTVSNIMFYIENDVVLTSYYLDGELS